MLVSDAGESLRISLGPSGFEMPQPPRKHAIGIAARIRILER